MSVTRVPSKTSVGDPNSLVIRERLFVMLIAAVIIMLGYSIVMMSLEPV